MHVQLEKTQSGAESAPFKRTAKPKQILASPKPTDQRNLASYHRGMLRTQACYRSISPSNENFPPRVTGMRSSRKFRSQRMVSITESLSSTAKNIRRKAPHHVTGKTSWKNLPRMEYRRRNLRPKMFSWSLTQKNSQHRTPLGYPKLYSS